MKYIAFDSHKRYTFASVEDQESGEVTDKRIEHERGALTNFLSRYESGCPVAVETLGSWYWIVEEIEAAGMEPRLVHARKAKMMLASSKKTDKLDAHGMNRLQRTGTLPTVWIPDGELRDKRELFRTRMVLSRQWRTLKGSNLHFLLNGNRGITFIASLPLYESSIRVRIAFRLLVWQRVLSEGNQRPMLDLSIENDLGREAVRRGREGF